MRSPLFVLVSYLLLLLTPAQADGGGSPHLAPLRPGKPDYSQVAPEIRNWFRDQISPKTKQRCCDESDGSQAQEDIRHGQYWTTWPAVAPKWFPVPDEVVIKAPNKAGHPVVWVTYLNGVPQIMCFAPGAGI